MDHHSLSSTAMHRKEREPEVDDSCQPHISLRCLHFLLRGHFRSAWPELGSSTIHERQLQLWLFSPTLRFSLVGIPRQPTALRCPVRVPPSQAPSKSDRCGLPICRLRLGPRSHAGSLVGVVLVVREGTLLPAQQRIHEESQSTRLAGDKTRAAIRTNATAGVAPIRRQITHTRLRRKS